MEILIEPGAEQIIREPDRHRAGRQIQKMQGGFIALHKSVGA